MHNTDSQEVAGPEQFGRPRDGRVATFDDPTEIAVSDTHLFVLDGSGGGLQVLDRDLNLPGGFNLPRNRSRELNHDNGLGADLHGNVYVSSFHGSMIRIFRADGICWLRLVNPESGWASSKSPTDCGSIPPIGSTWLTRAMDACKFSNSEHRNRSPLANRDGTAIQAGL